MPYIASVPNSMTGLFVSWSNCLFHLTPGLGGKQNESLLRFVLLYLFDASHAQNALRSVCSVRIPFTYLQQADRALTFGKALCTLNQIDTPRTIRCIIERQ